MKTMLVAHGATLAAFLALDAIWLSRMSGTLYRPTMGDMLLDGFRIAPALIFYVVYVVGLVHFGVRPGSTGGALETIGNAALFGFVAYATYDLTNQATLKSWSTVLTIADLAWGTFVSAAAASVGRAATLWLAPPVG
ncbi:MAG: DUF2177 family protein [Phyllobacteriaceae bacterium]|nr:DUF2177 family protein [Phyllobacteriaceae bacterium]